MSTTDTNDTGNLTIQSQKSLGLISIIIPIFNGSCWINRCFQSIIKQSAIGVVPIEICVCDDCSTDDTPRLLRKWKISFENIGLRFLIIRNKVTKGVGGSKNTAVSISSGTYLCFQDIDDVMFPDRILRQYEYALERPINIIIGTQFKREPSDSTARYTRWANTLTPEQLQLQVFTSHGPTVIMPTWFCHKSVFDKVGGFSEITKGCPEDLIFFYKHLDFGGKIFRVDEVLLVYTFHQNQATFSVKQQTIWNVRIERLEQTVLKNWNEFTIWNAGKQGRKFYNCLSVEHKKKVSAFCDVDSNKIGKHYRPFDDLKRKFEKGIPVIDYKNAKPPFIICMKIDLTEGVFEKNLFSLNLEEGRDYIIFN